MTSPASLYRIFKRAGGEAHSVRSIVIAMVVIAVGLTTVGVISVQRQHQVLRLGFELSRESSHVLELREAKRRLELERATLTAPDRIRRLATQLGMAPVAPDHVRIVKSNQLSER
jgi:cell division protein FtsL